MNLFIGRVDEPVHRSPCVGLIPGAEASRPEGGAAEPSSGSVASCSQSLPSFWIPSLTPQSKPTLLKKPVSQRPAARGQSVSSDPRVTLT